MSDRAECLERIHNRYPEIEVVSSMGNNLKLRIRVRIRVRGLKRLCEMLSLISEERLLSVTVKMIWICLKQRAFVMPFQNAW